MDVLQTFVYLRTYARFLWDEGRRETFPETVDRYINWAFRNPLIPTKVKTKSREKMLNLEAFGSMRALWTAGPAADIDNSVIYNCAFLCVDNLGAFGEALVNLMCGCGVGFSVELEYVNKLPQVEFQKNAPVYQIVVEDSRRGWKDALDTGVSAWFKGRDCYFDFSKLRPMGTPLMTMGGRSSGPEVLRELLRFTRDTILGAQGRQLTTLECHDIMCEIARVVIVGGTRRSALISLSDLSDVTMRSCKDFTRVNAIKNDAVRAQELVRLTRRAGSNNSAVYYGKPDIFTFLDEWSALGRSGTGERGIANIGGARKHAPHRRKSKLIKGLNPCKPLRSLVLTPDGYKTFYQLLRECGEHIEVVTPSGAIAKASKPFLSKKKASVWEVELSNGCRLYGTEDHLHKLSDGNWKRMDELVVGDDLESPYLPVLSLSPDTECQDYQDGLVAGWTWADGTVAEDILQVAFGVNEFDVLPMFEGIFDRSAMPMANAPDTCMRINAGIAARRRLLDMGYSVDKNNLSWLYLKSPSFKWGFIQAAFTADGAVRTEPDFNEVSLSSKYRDSLEVLCTVLREFGLFGKVCIKAKAPTYVAEDGTKKVCSMSWVLYLSAGQFKLVGLLSNFKSDRLGAQVQTGYRGFVNFLRVKSIHPNVFVEDVYDISVDSNEHSFIDTWITSHNCAEVALRDKEYCNLAEAVIRSDDDFESLRDKLTTAAWLSVIQSTFTNFPTLSKEWHDNCEDEHLCGVSITGQMDNPDLLTPEVLKLLKNHVVNICRKASQKLGIPMPAATTSCKPSGTLSAVCNSSPGLHPRWDDYYLRSIQIATNDPLFMMMADQGVPYFIPTGNGNSTAVLQFPVAAPKGAITRNTVTAMEQLEHYKKVTTNYTEHSASCTIYVAEHEWLSVANWVYDNWDMINGLTFFPKEDNKNGYEWVPYKSLTEEEYDKQANAFPNIDFSRLPDYEHSDNTTGAKEIACSGGACELV